MALVPRWNLANDARACDMSLKDEMRPRITLLRTDEGVIELFFNEAGKALLISEIGRLGETNDHLHMSTEGYAEIELSEIPYRPTDEVIGDMKLLFRTDDSDREFFPHVLGNSGDSGDATPA